MAGIFGGHHHRHGHHHGIGPLGLAVESAVVGGAAAAAVATAVAARRGGRRMQPPLPRQEVVIVSGASGLPVSAPPARVAQPAYISGGVLRRGPAASSSAVHPLAAQGPAGGVVVVQQAALERPLAVAAVRLTAEAAEWRDKVLFYAVDVSPEHGAAWRVMRRYNDFFSLRRLLGLSSRAFPGAPFPPKELFCCAGQRLEDRRQALELWLRRALEGPSSAGAWLRPLRDFLEAGRQPIVAEGPPVPATVAVPASLPPTALTLPPPAAQAPSLLPPPAAGPATGPEEAEEVELLQIEIPPGVSAGQLLGVNLPNGQQLVLPVPSGLSAGATLELLYDTAAGTLTPAS